jgi:P4 family phage/plasmid primase-like protien
MSKDNIDWVRRLVAGLETDDKNFHPILGHGDMVHGVLLPALQDKLRFVPELDRFVARDENRIWDSSPAGHRTAIALVEKWIRIMVSEMRLRIAQSVQMMSQGYKMSVLAYLADQETIIRPLADWDVRPWELQTPGGVVDLRDGTIRPTAVTDFHLNCTAVTPDLGGPPPEVFVGMLASGFEFAREHLEYLRTGLGASLFGDNSEQALRWLIGESGSGKSSLLLTVKDCLGSYARVCASTLFVATKDERLSPAQERAAMGRLALARFALCDEINQRGLLSSRVCKTVTNNDMVEAEEKYQPVREVMVRTNVWIVANNMPARIEGGDTGFERRMQIIEMSGKPARDDKGLRDKLKAEHPQILAWLIDAAHSWFMFGSAPAPLGSVSLVSKLTETTTLVPRWWEERWVFDWDDTHRVFAVDLWKDFSSVWWPKQHEATARGVMDVPMAEIEFYRQVRDLIIRKCAKGDNSWHSEQLRIEGDRRAGYRGVNRKP